MVGNPLEPSLLAYGFSDNIRDEGRVTDGVIKGPSCDCDSARSDYMDVGGIVETFKTYPDHQFDDLEDKPACIACLRDDSLTEAD